MISMNRSPVRTAIFECIDNVSVVTANCYIVLATITSVSNSGVECYKFRLVMGDLTLESVKSKTVQKNVKNKPLGQSATQTGKLNR